MTWRLYLRTLLGAALLFFAGARVSMADTLNVPGDYKTISEAIDAASPGDVISIAAGDYDERLVIDKDLTLVGAGAGGVGQDTTTIWYSTPMDTLITVDGARVTLRDMKIGGATDDFGSLEASAFMGVFADGGTVTIERCRFVGISYARVKIVDGQYLTMKDTYSSNLPFNLVSDLGIRIENTDFLIQNLNTPSGSQIDHNIDVGGDATGIVEDSYLGSSRSGDHRGQAFRINRDNDTGYFPSITIRNNVIEGHSNETKREGDAIGLYAGVGTIVDPAGTYQIEIHGNEIRDWPIGIAVKVGATSTENNPIKICDNLIEDNHLYGVHIRRNEGYTGMGDTRGVDLGGGLGDSPGGNIIRSNDTFDDAYAIYHESTDTLDARFNTWAATSADSIDGLIYDDDESAPSGTVRFGGYTAARVQQVVVEGQPVDFGASTGVDIDFVGVSADDTVTVRRYEGRTVDIVGISEANVSAYGWIIESKYDPTYEAATAVRFDLGEIPDPAITDPADVTVYRRALPGTGVFTALTTTYDGASNEFVATGVQHFGEFVFASNDPSLPVELADLAATVVEEGARLTWQTLSETNNAGFAVERRGETGEWAHVGFVAGRGTTTAPQHYRFTDETVSFEAQAVMYRLKQVDRDGADHYVAEVEVRRSTPERLVLHGSYPNPFRAQTTIRYALPRAMPVHITVFNAQGRQVATPVQEVQAAGRKELTIDAHDWASGLYFVRFTAGDRTRTRRLTVVK